MVVRPLIFEGVIIGKITVDDDEWTSIEVTSEHTRSYFKELLADVESITLSMNRPEEEQDRGSYLGHLRIVRSSESGNQEAEARGRRA